MIFFELCRCHYAFKISFLSFRVKKQVESTDHFHSSPLSLNPFVFKLCTITLFKALSLHPKSIDIVTEKQCFYKPFTLSLETIKNPFKWYIKIHLNAFLSTQRYKGTYFLLILQAYQLKHSWFSIIKRKNKSK